MGLLREMLEGFAEGMMAAKGYRSAPSRGRIEGLLAELGWSADEQDGDMIRLHFGDQGGVVRKVRIAGGDSAVVTFSADSFAVIPARNLKGELLAYLLARNLEVSGVGQWAMYVADNKNVTFHLVYSALGAGLDAQALKWVCESLVAEAAEFDAKMQQAGLLR